MKSNELRDTIYKRDGGICIYCGKKISIEEMNLDHKFPEVFGGSNDEDNLLCSCRECNMKKTSKLLLRRRDMVDIIEERDLRKDVESKLNDADFELRVYQYAIDIVYNYNQYGVDRALKGVEELRELLIQRRSN